MLRTAMPPPPLTSLKRKSPAEHDDIVPNEAGIDGRKSAHRIIQPRPLSFISPEKSYPQYLPSNFASALRKKMGRPSKAEVKAQNDAKRLQDLEFMKKTPDHRALNIGSLDRSMIEHLNDKPEALNVPGLSKESTDAERFVLSRDVTDANSPDLGAREPSSDHPSHSYLPSDSGYQTGNMTDAASVFSLDSVETRSDIPKAFLQDFISTFGDLLIGDGWTMLLRVILSRILNKAYNVC